MIFSLVDQRGISVCHLNGSRPVGQSAQGGRRIIIIRNEPGKFHLPDVGKCFFRSQTAEQPPGTAVDGFFHRPVQTHAASRQRCSLRSHLLCLRDIDIPEHGFCRIAIVQRRRIDCQRLEGAARLPVGLIRPVQCIHIRLLASSSHNGNHLMRLVVNHR